MNTITLQDQYEFLGVDTIDNVVSINSEQESIKIVESVINTTWHKTIKSANLGTIEVEGERVKRYVTLCESNGIKFVLNRYLANGFTMRSYTFNGNDLTNFPKIEVKFI